MIRCKIFLCAEDAVRDAETERVSIFNIIEEISSVTFPVVMTRLATFALLERELEDPEKTSAHLHVDLNGEELLEQDLPLDFQGKPHLRVFVMLNGLPIVAVGTLAVELQVGGQQLASYVIEVKQRGQPEVQVTQT